MAAHPTWANYKPMTKRHIETMAQFAGKADTPIVIDKQLAALALAPGRAIASQPPSSWKQWRALLVAAAQVKA
jgi:hypothetical protein